MDTNYDEEKRKYECMNPQQWAASAKRLINERDTIEKKILHKDMELIREWNNLDKGRQENLAATSKKIKWFKFHLDKILVRLQDQLNNGGMLGEYYDQVAAKENLQEMLESFESKLSAFKQKMRTEFDELDREERQLTTDIVALHNRIEHPVSDAQPEDCGHVHISLGEHQAELLKKTQQQIRQQQQQRMQEDVEHKAAIGEIDRELAGLGKHGGWDVRDHDVFLRTWNVYFGNNELVKRIEDPETKEITFVFSITTVQERQLFRKLEHDVFAKSADELREHVQWYGKTLELLAKKKRLLSDWKTAQNNRKRSMNNEILMEEQLATANELEVINAPKEEDDDDLLKAKGEEEEKRMQAKSRIAKWKQDRLKQQQEEELQKRLQAAKKQKEAADERKRRQDELKVQLVGWKKEEAKPLTSRSEPARPKTDNATLKQRYERDMDLAKVRKGKADQQAMKKTERERKLNSGPNLFDGDVQRDPARLLNATKASEAAKIHEEDLDAAQHRRASSGAHSAPIAMSGRDLAHAGRATPAWMRPQRS